jgi:UPF0755 protein
MIKRKYLLIAGLIVALLFATIFLIIFKLSNTAFSDKQKIVFVLSVRLDSVATSLREQGVIRNETSFRIAAALKSIHKVVPGRYLFTSGESNQSILNKLRIGNQTPVSIRLDGVASVDQLPALFGKYLQRDSAYFASTLLQADTIRKLGFTSDNYASFFIADTYSFLWTDDANDILKRMKSIYRNYWSDSNLALAQSLGMSCEEVATIATIVHGETGDHEDAKLVAGLYINRLRAGIPLQADPTVLFAIRANNRQRVLNEDLAIDSPYNTYRYAGLPPGPISLPVAGFMNDVLNYTPSEYLYMCARPGTKGHNFTKSYEEHLRNAKEYRNWLDAQSIRR